MMLQPTLIELIEGKQYDRCEECGEVKDKFDRCGCDYNP